MIEHFINGADPRGDMTTYWLRRGPKNPNLMLGSMLVIPKTKGGAKKLVPPLFPPIRLRCNPKTLQPVRVLENASDLTLRCITPYFT